MLDDPMLIERAAAIVRERAAQRRVGAAALAASRFPHFFDRAEDPYLRERKGDVADVVGRLCMNLRATGDPPTRSRASTGRWCWSPTRSRRR